MYSFIAGQWYFRKITEKEIAIFVAKGFITQEEADFILATPQKEIK